MRQRLTKAKNGYVSGFLSDAIHENPKSVWSYIKKTKSCDQAPLFGSNPGCKSEMESPSS